VKAPVTLIKNIDAGAEVTKDTAKVFGCPMILKVGPPTLADCNDEQPDNPDLIDPIKTMCVVTLKP
jgi:hypothetical protein